MAGPRRGEGQASGWCWMLVTLLSLITGGIIGGALVYLRLQNAALFACLQSSANSAINSATPAPSLQTALSSTPALAAAKEAPSSPPPPAAPTPAQTYTPAPTREPVKLPLTGPTQLTRRIVTDVEAELRAELRALQIDSALVDCAAVPHQMPLLRDLGLQSSCISNTSQAAAPSQRLALVYAVPKSTDPLAAGALLHTFSSGLPYSATIAVQLRLHATAGESAAVFLTDRSGMHRLLYSANAMHRNTFELVYQYQVWGKGPDEGLGSGAGSSLANTHVIRTRLVELIRQHNITSMIDSSCGSMHWMQLVLDQLGPNFRFMGLDVACSLIQQHSKNFTTRFPNAKFKCVDYAHEPLPGGYELVFSRDSLQHLPLYASWQFLHQVRNAGARMLLVGSYVFSAWGVNRLIKPGEYFNIDLTKPPFNVRPKPPLESIAEGTADGKHMLLFNVSAMTWDEPLTYL